MNKDKMQELTDLLIKSLDQSWEKVVNLNEGDRKEIFFKHMENKLSYMKDEGFIEDFTVNEKKLDE